jgi:hypothetical protein
MIRYVIIKSTLLFCVARLSCAHLTMPSKQPTPLQRIEHFVPALPGPPDPQPVHVGGGLLDVLMVHRIIQPRTGSDALKQVFTLVGSPASGRSVADHAQVTFIPDDQELPLPRIDLSDKRIDLFYPMTQLTEIMRMLSSGRKRLLYCWRSQDEARALSWFISFP